MQYRYSGKVIIRVTASFVLNILAGILRTMLNFNYLFKMMNKDEKDCFRTCFGYIFSSVILEHEGIIYYYGILFCIFFPDIATKAGKIAFLICYSFSVLMAISLTKDNNETNIDSNPIKKS